MKAICIFYLLFDFRLSIDKLIIYCIVFIDLAIQWIRNGFWLSTIHQINNIKEIITSCNTSWFEKCRQPVSIFIESNFFWVDLLCTESLFGCFSNFFLLSTILVSLWKVFIKKSCCLFCMYLFYFVLFLFFLSFFSIDNIQCSHDTMINVNWVCYATCYHDCFCIWMIVKYIRMLYIYIKWHAVYTHAVTYAHIRKRAAYNELWGSRNRVCVAIIVCFLFYPSIIVLPNMCIDNWSHCAVYCCRCYCNAV